MDFYSVRELVKIKKKTILKYTNIWYNVKKKTAAGKGQFGIFFPSIEWNNNGRDLMKKNINKKRHAKTNMLT